MCLLHVITTNDVVFNIVLREGANIYYSGIILELVQIRSWCKPCYFTPVQIIV